MSRIGNRILSIPAGVTIDIQPTHVTVTGPKGVLKIDYNKKMVTVENADNKIIVKRLNEIKQTKMLHGTVNANIANAIIGVTEEFKKELVLKGVGYKAKVEGKKIVLALGFSHPVELEIPATVKVETPSATEIVVSGPNKQMVGELCAVIRSYRMPEPYKGKGVLFKNEQIIRKAGKKADK
ncbi:MAG: 50S ribosomal protein L6 [Mycoplasma sp.]